MLGEQLKKLLDEHQITQKKLANDLSIAVSTLNGYMNDYREPDIKTLSLFAQYFHVSVDFLVEHPSGDGLNQSELELIRIYRLLTEEQKEFLYEQAKLYLRHNTKKEELLNTIS
jgi:transcriptional regulator with XRE-family HTH domain